MRVLLLLSGFADRDVDPTGAKTGRLGAHDWGVGNLGAQLDKALERVAERGREDSWTQCK
ncbi:MAG: hypothetical protein C4297_09365 [Gemmataceae bacterium]